MVKTTISIAPDTKIRLEKTRVSISYSEGMIVDHDTTLLHLMDLYETTTKPQPKPKPKSV
ncbi:MAG: hypothetical protein F4Y18_02790 [Cenarchaeum sp. SB0663_bin_5]|nr:hypothetical protein [Cenarchaeum sp. SB0663_bin_5]MYL11509.1 hypothetical protein [Cenarchaeum sp. SB0669_bin_11]